MARGSAITQMRNPRLLSLTVHVAVAAVCAIGLLLVPDLLVQIATAALCLSFGLVEALGLRRVTSVRGASLYFATQAALVGTIIAVSGISDPFNFLLFVLGIQAAALLPARAAVAWTAVLFLVSAAAALALRGASAPITILFNAGAFAITAGYGYTLRQVEVARAQNEDLLAELRDAQRLLREQAVAEERDRLARDLHDSAKQQGFALSAQLDAARSLLRQDPAAAEPHLDRAVELADGLRRELAALILDLRPSALRDGGLPGALRAAAAGWSRCADVPAEVTVVGTGPLPVATEGALLRIAQEALANAYRHSGAGRVGVHLVLAPRRVELRVRDDGRGFDPDQVAEGLGLASMRERAAALPGGTLAVESAPGAGTTISVRCDQGGSAQ